MQVDPVRFVREQGWPFKESGDELITTCPFCHKPEHLYMNADNGLWICHRCNEKGNLPQLKRRLGLDDGFQSIGQELSKKAPPKTIPIDGVDERHLKLLADSEAFEYCTQVRCWSQEVIKRFKLGLRKDKRGKWISFPWLRGDQIIGEKYRILPRYEKNHPDRFERLAGCESILFNLNAAHEFDELILSSGESDALSLLSLGFPNVSGLTTGEKSLPPSAIDLLSKKKRVWIVFDQDETGSKGAVRLATRISLERAWIVELPEGVHDVNDFLAQGGTQEQFKTFMEQAKQIDIETIYSIPNALDKLEKEKTVGNEDRPDEVTPWTALNQKLGTWSQGNLIVVSGPQGTGKTTWTLNIAAHWAEQGWPCLFYCLEMKVEELVSHVLCQNFCLTEDQITSDVIHRAREELSVWPLYLGSNPAITGRDEVIDLLKQAIRRYGLRLIIFDNLHMLARSVDHRSEEVGAITKSMKLLAMECDIPIVLVAQPRKLQPGRVMTPWDLKDSVDIYSDADQVVLLHRELRASIREGKAVADADDDKDIMSPLTLVRIAKSRRVAGKDTLLYFEGAQHRFRERHTGETER